MQESAIIPFHDADLRAARDGDQVYIAIKPICEHLGIDASSQLQKLRGDGDFQLMGYPIISTDGKTYEMACLPQEQLLGWLYTINSSRVGRDSRSLLSVYRRETTKAINDYWTKGEAKNPRQIALPQTFAEALRLAADLEAERERLAARVLEDAPKVESFEAYIGTDGLHDFNSAAKALGWGRNKMLKELRGRGVLMSGGDRQNVPYQSYLDRGYFEVKTRSVKNVVGFERVTTTTYVTPRGLEYLRRILGTGDNLRRAPKETP